MKKVIVFLSLALSNAFGMNKYKFPIKPSLYEGEEENSSSQYLLFSVTRKEYKYINDSQPESFILNDYVFTTSSHLLEFLKDGLEDKREFNCGIEKMYALLFPKGTSRYIYNKYIEIYEALYEGIGMEIGIYGYRGWQDYESKAAEVKETFMDVTEYLTKNASEQVYNDMVAVKRRIIKSAKQQIKQREKEYEFHAKKKQAAVHQERISCPSSIVQKNPFAR